jgi:hypothetical protein
MNNVLTGTIKIDAPGVQRTFNDISESTKKLGQNLQTSTTGFDKIVGSMNKTEQAAGRTSKTITQGFDQSTKSTERFKSSVGGITAPLSKVDGAVTKSKTNMLEWGRVIQDLPYGFSGIANNLTQIVPAVGGLGLAFSAVVTGITFAQVGLSNWVRGLSSSKNSIDDNILALGQFANELENIKADIDNFGNSLDYANKIGKLQVDIGFGKGPKSDLIDLRGQSIENLTLTDKLEKKFKEVSIISDKIRETLINELVKPGNDKYFEAFDKGVLGAIDDLPDKLQKIYKSLQDSEKEQTDVSDKIIKARQDQNILYSQIAQKKIDISEDERKKAEEAAKKAEQLEKERLARDKKYLEERLKIIAQFSADFAAFKVFSLPVFKDDPKNAELIKRLQSDLDKLIIQKLPEIAIKIKLDEKSKKDFVTGLEKLKAPTVPTITNNTDQSLKLNVEGFEKQGEEIGRRLGDGFDKVFRKIFRDAIDGAISSGLSGEALENFKTQFESVAVIASQGIQGIGDAFGSLTEALLDGQNGMQAFGEALKNTFKQIAIEIVKDIVLAGILSVLSGGASGGGLSFIGALGKIIGGSHASGLKRVPKDGYIAELHKDEMVVPAKQSEKLRSIMGTDFSIPSLDKIFGSIGVSDMKSSLPSIKGIQIPNIQVSQINAPQLPSTSFARVNKTTAMGMGKQNVGVQVEVVGKISGSDIVVAHNRTLRKQNIAF